jgi:hypothetical protein
MDVLYIFISDMDLETHFRGHYDKQAYAEVNAWIGTSQERFDTFMPYFLHEEFRICQHAAWTLGQVGAKRPWLMEKWIPEILNAMDHPKHDAVIRNAIRAFQEMDDLPDEYEGEIFDRCFNYLLDPKSPIAFKAFSMTVCRKVAMKYPDLKGELIEVIEDALINGSAGIISRGKKELKILRKS